MKTHRLTTRVKTRVIKKYGDSAIMLGFYTTEWWNNLLKEGGKMAFWKIFISSLKFVLALFADAIGSIFRYKHGIMSKGWILTFYTVFLIVLFNSSACYHVLKPFLFWFVPFLGFAGVDWIIIWTLGEIHSFQLLVFAFVYMLFSVVHVIISYVRNETEDASKRGDSWLYQYLFRHTGFVPESVIQIVLEPFLAFIMGWYFWQSGDAVFGAFLCIAALSMFSQDYLDWAHQQKQNTSIV